MNKPWRVFLCEAAVVAATVAFVADGAETWEWLFYFGVAAPIVLIATVLAPPD